VNVLHGNCDRNGNSPLLGRGERSSNYNFDQSPHSPLPLGEGGRRPGEGCLLAVEVGYERGEAFEALAEALDHFTEFGDFGAGLALFA